MAPKTLHYNPKTLMSGSIKVGPICSSLRASTSPLSRCSAIENQQDFLHFDTLSVFA